MKAEEPQRDVIRAFIAVELPDSVKEEMARVRRVLDEAGADVKWTDPAAAHLTLKFLGNIPVTAVDRLAAELSVEAASVRPFVAELCGVGVFPSRERPRVLWIGVGKGGDDLVSLAGAVEASLKRTGVRAEEKPYRPHVTLGRLRTRKRADILMRSIDTVSIADISFDVDSIVLFRSTLTSGGAVHAPLRTMPIGVGRSS